MKTMSLIYGRRNAPPRDYLPPENLARIGIPRLYFDAEITDYKTDNEDIMNLMTNYIEFIHDMFDECVNLTLYGSNGSGKTFITSIILKNAYRNRYSARRITFSHFISMAFKKNKSEEEVFNLDMIYNAEFLVIDELGKENDLASGANVNLLEDLMKYREEKGYPTIICTNLNLGDIHDRYGNTIYSLVSQSVRIEMEGEDMRNQVFVKRGAVAKLFGED